MLAKTGDNRRFIGRLLSIPWELTSSHVFNHDVTRRDGPSLWGVILPLHHMLFADFWKVIAVDSEDDSIGEERPPNPPSHLSFGLLLIRPRGWMLHITRRKWLKTCRYHFRKISEKHVA